MALLVVGLLLLPAAPSRADSGVCVGIDEARDTFSPHDREAALLLLVRQLEVEGEHVVPAGCPMSYVIAHIQLGETIVITLSGPNGSREATALGMMDVAAVYSQMVRSLLRNQPMDAPGIVNRANVSASQAAAHRIHSDSLAYARLGYAGTLGDRVYHGPAVGLIGYRKELDSFAIDVSFLNFFYRTDATDAYGLVPADTSGTTATWVKLEMMRFFSPLADRSFYAGAGLGWSTADLTGGSRTWSGSGLEGELTAGYEFGRVSTIRVFIQADAALPFYTMRSSAYVFSPLPPYIQETSSERRYMPSLGISLGLGWQRGNGK